jgi:hypothetical protein
MAGGTTMRTVLFISMFLTACATPIGYYKEGATEEQFQKDKYDCTLDAEQRSAGNPFLAGDYHQECMQKKHGYKIDPNAVKP